MRSSAPSHILLSKYSTHAFGNSKSHTQHPSTSSTSQIFIQTKCLSDLGRPTQVFLWSLVWVNIQTHKQESNIGASTTTTHMIAYAQATPYHACYMTALLEPDSHTTKCIFNSTKKELVARPHVSPLIFVCPL